jgi:hypothetical protein
LLDEQDGIFRCVKSDGAEMLRASVDGDVHIFSRTVNSQWSVVFSNCGSKRFATGC